MIRERVEVRVAPGRRGEPARQLPGFEKVRLKWGESKEVALALDRNRQAAWDTDTDQWRVSPGTYTVMVGASSRDIALPGRFPVGSR